MAALDTELLLLLSRRTYYAAHPDEGDLSAEESRPIYIALKYTGSIAAIEAAGFTTGTAIGRIAYGSTTLAGLAKLAIHPQVEHIEAQRLQTPDLHSSVPELGANLAWTRSGDNFSGYTGKGVYVGVIDTGIDFKHHAFRKGNVSRIYRLWDQTLIKQGTENVPRPITDVNIMSGDPTPLGYGVEYSNNEINQILSGTSGAMPVRHRDVDGHGSHVAGIAAGDGSQSGGCHLGYHYIGVAPDAELIVVRLWGLSDEDSRRAKLPPADPQFKPAPTTPNDYMFDAIRFILNEVKNAPGSDNAAVINMSFGHFSDRMDGSSADCITLDQLLSNNSVGRAFVNSAGNNGNLQLHAAGNVPPAGPEPASIFELEVYMPAGDTRNRTISILYSGNNLQAELQSPVAGAPGKISWVNSRPGPVFPALAAEQSATANGAGAGSLVTLTNIPNRIAIGIAPRTSGKNKAGTWRIRLKNTTAVPTYIDALIVGGKYNSLYFKTHHTNVSTLGEYASAFDNISVGNYKVGGALAASSSRGPTLDVPSRIIPKPELAAPGEDIMSAGLEEERNQAEDYLKCRKCCCACCEDYYVEKSGTSMAAPHITGLIALMLHKNPTLTHIEIRDYLVTTCLPEPDDTSLADHFGWGAGKANAFNVMQAIPQINPPVNPIVAVDPAMPTMLFEKFLQTERGPELAEVVREYGRELLALINHNKRVATIWHRVRGPQWVRYAIKATYQKEAVIPGNLEDIFFSEGLRRFTAIIKRYASPAFLKILNKYETDIFLVQPGRAVEDLIMVIGNRNDQHNGNTSNPSVQQAAFFNT